MEDLDEARQMVADCIKRSDKMSDYEQNTYIPFINKQLVYGRGLTDHQTKQLTQLWEKVTTNG